MNDFAQLLTTFVKAGKHESEYVSSFYSLMHPDLKHLSGRKLRGHYVRHGRTEGRIASPAAHRKGFLAQIAPTDGVLEIGPATRPALRGENVKYFDLAAKAELQQRAKEHRLPFENCPTIDYVSGTGDLGMIRERFDGVFSSHCIEHQPNLIGHLQQVSRMLKWRGRYFLIMPDKRFCFDALFPESTIAEVVQADAEDRRVHTAGNVRRHYAETTHNDSAAHWAGRHDDPHGHGRDHRLREAEAAIERAAGAYIDVHAWFFTPQSFRGIIDELNRRNLISLRILRLHDTLRDSNEFCAILEKTVTRSLRDEIAETRRRRREDRASATLAPS